MLFSTGLKLLLPWKKGNASVNTLLHSVMQLWIMNSEFTFLQPFCFIFLFLLFSHLFKNLLINYNLSVRKCCEMMVENQYRHCTVYSSEPLPSCSKCPRHFLWEKNRTDNNHISSLKGLTWKTNICIKCYIFNPQTFCLHLVFGG